MFGRVTGFGALVLGSLSVTALLDAGKTLTIETLKLAVKSLFS